ncbi:hypothetical protein LWF15_15720 [Kineosporia rhizophila]|uniref:hypothetical protein n=1 Tax=Kineosporia rhizophila TaxID=84633 RepID=UPI001E647069|nr:hypothetical protein [Kineosporia rhizophila]MCE0536951.1 hypothetical protein [Kineosporia rhizophila]
MSSARVFSWSGAISVLLLAGVALAGDSAAVPGLGPATWYPSWDLGLGLNSGTVSAVLAVAAVLGAVAVVAGLRAVGGSFLAPRQVLIAVVAAVAVLTLLPPLGSADHLSYLAYGRIAAAGDDPYVEDPAAWRDGTDPVAGAVQPPWQHTTSVYGPVATAAQALPAWAGDGSLRLTVWIWQIFCGLAFLAVALTLDRLTRGDPAARARTWVLWTLNPLLLGQIVLGGHLDVISVAFAIGAIALASRRPALAGVLIGAAVGSKITFGLFALAILWGLRHRPWPELARHLGVMASAGLAVLVPVHLWTGWHTYDRLSAASSQVSLATPWRLVTNQLDPVFGSVVRDVVGPLSMALGAVLVVLLLRRLRAHPTGISGDTETAAMARAAFALAAGWLLMTPYSLPWYDSMVWAPLALLAPTLLDGALLARLFVLVLAYVPGRVVGMSVQVEEITLGFRKSVAPWLELAVIVTVVVWTCLRWKDFRASATPDDEEQRRSSASLAPGSTDSTPARPTE